jgi:alkanesulfonate monooxygenase SsuD/methylene tetrahydromethanopterin reductase-like flavin-dependent oxidoreductase (luciferase family)
VALNEESYKRPFRALEPAVLLAALATQTSHIGLVCTVPALYGNPATVARQIASLDHVSKGRAAWNIITSQHAQTLDIFGLEGELAPAAKYDKADEFVSIVTQLWDSLPPAAIVADAERSVYVDGPSW